MYRRQLSHPSRPLYGYVIDFTALLASMQHANVWRISRDVVRFFRRALLSMKVQLGREANGPLTRGVVFICRRVQCWVAGPYSRCSKPFWIKPCVWLFLTRLACRPRESVTVHPQQSLVQRKQRWADEFSKPLRYSDRQQKDGQSHFLL